MADGCEDFQEEMTSRMRPEVQEMESERAAERILTEVSVCEKTPRQRCRARIWKSCGKKVLEESRD